VGLAEFVYRVGFSATAITWRIVVGFLWLAVAGAFCTTRGAGTGMAALVTYTCELQKVERRQLNWSVLVVLVLKYGPQRGGLSCAGALMVTCNLSRDPVDSARCFILGVRFKIPKGNLFLVYLIYGMIGRWM
jgi:hypothetical protein